MTEHHVPNSVGAMSLPRYLQRAWPLLPGYAIKKEDVRLNGARWDGKAAVRGGDLLRLYIQDGYLTGPLRKLYADDRILAVEKPAGLPVDVDDLGIGVDTLLARAVKEYPAARLCHRLDTGTGGALLLALTEEAEAELREAFAAQRVGKTYHAMVKACAGNGGRLMHYLRKDARAARVTVLDSPGPGARQAELYWKPVEHMGERMLVEVKLMTGRTHQIRAQLAHIGCPLLGDDKYGDRAFNKRWHVSSPMLWCVRLEYGGIAVESKAPFAREEAP